MGRRRRKKKKPAVTPESGAKKRQLRLEAEYGLPPNTMKAWMAGQIKPGKIKKANAKEHKKLVEDPNKKKRQTLAGQKNRRFYVAGETADPPAKFRKRRKKR